MVERLIRAYDYVFYVLIAYFVYLFVLSGLTYIDLVNSMVWIMILYGIPVGIFVCAYLLIVGSIVYRKARHNDLLAGATGVIVRISVKAFVAILPLFYFNNNMANVLAYLNKVAK